MAFKQAVPDAVNRIRVSRIKCDFQSGTTRFVARLAPDGQTSGVKAIWRNEIGKAEYTPARLRT
ncbi:hypothetical protein Z946_4024 [Sulfitobacter noctilucicola]|nr:hypothetical protein Z946_4024 [Sulfitobacter noctilucicola]